MVSFAAAVTTIATADIRDCSARGTTTIVAGTGLCMDTQALIIITAAYTELDMGRGVFTMATTATAAYTESNTEGGVFTAAIATTVVYTESETAATVFTMAVATTAVYTESGMDIEVPTTGATITAVSTESDTEAGISTTERATTAMVTVVDLVDCSEDTATIADTEMAFTSRDMEEFTVAAHVMGVECDLDLVALWVVATITVADTEADLMVLLAGATVTVVDTGSCVGAGDYMRGSMIAVTGTGLSAGTGGFTVPDTIPAVCIESDTDAKESTTAYVGMDTGTGCLGLLEAITTTNATNIETGSSVVAAITNVAATDVGTEGSLEGVAINTIISPDVVLIFKDMEGFTHALLAMTVNYGLGLEGSLGTAATYTTTEVGNKDPVTRLFFTEIMKHLLDPLLSDATGYRDPQGSHPNCYGYYAAQAAPPTAETTMVATFQAAIGLTCATATMDMDMLGQSLGASLLGGSSINMSLDRAIVFR